MSLMVSQKEIAEYLGITTRTIREYQEKGIIEKTKSGQYDLKGCIQKVVEHLRGAAAGRKNEASGTIIDEQKIRIVTAQADKIERENDVALGKLLDCKEVEIGIIYTLANLRTKLLSVPSKIAPEIASLKKTNECFELLTDLVHEVLSELAEIEINDEIKIDTACESCGHYFGFPVNPAPAVKNKRKRVGGQVSKIKPRSQRGSRKIQNKPR
jgi:phage terminase Nu1 subunit (DNA packaging protein)